ncbi:hypothetical protein BDZ88DRAFT_453674 [Geranomyces variabilis]|nr:hypothetical protein BDZ88DRAFT_453674 [Geranomyces variabilis]KAJ3137706.1 DNA mismatch repair protein [Geranomyces variabilis]
MTTIQQLPESVVEQLRAGLVIGSLHQCVIELVQNALDAHATLVRVLVNVHAASVEVSDNGHGIDPASLKLIGQRYATSKMGNHDTGASLGFRGEAIASLAEVSRVEITSRSNYMQTYTVTMKDGQQTVRPAAVARRRGTTASIHDLFYKYPVRRKLLLNDNALESVKRAMEAIALAFPEVVFTLIDECKDTTVLVTRKAESSQSTFRQLFGISLVQDLTPVAYERHGFRFSGFFSAKGFASKYHQYIYVNQHLMSPNEIHAAVNRVFANSRLGYGDEDDDEFTSFTASQKSKYSIKLTRRMPIFLLKISCPPHTCDVLLDPNKNMVEFQNWSLIIGIVEDLARNFLVDSGLYDNVSDADSMTGERSESDNDRADMFEDVSPELDVASPQSYASRPVLEKMSYPAEVSSDAADDESGDLLEEHTPEITTTSSGSYALWQDQTKHGYYVDQRSGNSYRKIPGDSRDQEKRSANPVDTRRLRGKTLERTPGTQFRNLMFDDALKKWKNPVFKRAEKGIHQLARDARQPRSFADKARRLFSRASNDEVAGSLSKAQLSAMKVIAQVDDKFILCSVPSETPGTDLLIMVDQHAADERVRLEVLLEELYHHQGGDGEHEDDADASNRVVDTVRLDPPCRILMDAREAHAAIRYAARFARWGLVFSSPDISSHDDDAGQKQQHKPAMMNPDAMLRIDVTELPRLIADRCVVDPGVTRDVLRQHVFFLENGNTGAGNGAKCPKGILEILHSKACRWVITRNAFLAFPSVSCELAETQKL